VLLETGAQRSVVRCCRAGLRQNYEVPGGQFALEPESFAREALQSVAVHGAFRGSTRNRQAQTGARTSRGPCKDGKEAIGGSGGLCKHATELGRRVQALLGREPFPVPRQFRAKTQSATV
jgi:hypothetical protein